MNIERHLASVRAISDIQPIEGADKIELCIVDGWKVVAQKGLYEVNDLVIYCEIDSFLPVIPEFEFLRKSCYKKLKNGVEGFRIKTIKLRGQISQGLLLPISVLNPPDTNIYISAFEGLNVTEMLGIIKYEPPIPAELAGKIKGNFPSFIPKTDEERIQNLASKYDELKQFEYHVTEKLDGSSATFYFNNGVFGVCSRNIDLLETEGNSFWKVARELDIENKLNKLPFNAAIQGELIGEGIQGNPYNIKGQTVRFFNMFNIDTQTYYDYQTMVEFTTSVGLQVVPEIYKHYTLPGRIDDLISEAAAASQLNSKFSREGIVLRNREQGISFKVISNVFLLNEQ